jgi:hypothetical protein
VLLVEGVVLLLLSLPVLGVCVGGGGGACM